MTSPPYVGKIANSGSPVLIPKLEVDGVSGGGALPGQPVEVITRLAITSDSPRFYPMAHGLAVLLDPHTGKALHRGECILVVIKQDRSAQVWFDTAAVVHDVMMKRPASFGTAVFAGDIVDVQGMRFPCVDIEASDQVIVLFREQWRYALYFDFNPTRNLDREELGRALGTLYRSLAYRNQYELMRDADTRKKLFDYGWFPFAEIAQTEFLVLAQRIDLGMDMCEAEEPVIASFTRERLDRILERWGGKPSYAEKKAIFSSGIDAFLRRDPVASIKIMLTEVEGILNSEHEIQRGKRLRRIEPLVDFAIGSAEAKAGGPNTLLFPQEFKEYLRANTFASFDPRETKEAEAKSRHAVGHGAAKAESYTLSRALQVILTLDQLLFYL
jgi:hypothetical protein